MNPEDALISLATAGDLDEIHVLYRDLHESDPPASDEALKTAFTEIIDDPRTRLYLLRTGGIAVSSCVLHIHANLTRQARPYGRIENLVTAKGSTVDTVPVSSGRSSMMPGTGVATR